MRNFELQLAARKGTHQDNTHIVIEMSDSCVCWLMLSDEISGEIFDLLVSLGEFSEFKEMMLAYKRVGHEAKGVGGISISGRHLTGLHEDGQQEKGMSP
jgi:hypothetical protein